MKLQIVSDIHLEFPKTYENLPPIEPIAPYLALLGDIGYPSQPIYKKFLLECAKKFKKVFVLAGNHEYYNAEYYSTNQQIKNICDSHNNLIFLEKTSWVCPEEQVRICGTTLWSYIPEQLEKQAMLAMNDYHVCKIKDVNGIRNFTTKDTVKWFNESLNWIKSELKQAEQLNQTVVMLTHHAPLVSGTSHPRYDGNWLNCAFATNLDDLFGKPIHTWAFGHTHYNSDRVIKGTRLVSNQIGYIRENCKTTFKPKLVLDIPSK